MEQPDFQHEKLLMSVCPRLLLLKTFGMIATRDQGKLLEQDFALFKKTNLRQNVYMVWAWLKTEHAVEVKAQKFPF
jgi:hypothetical protein